MCANVCLLDGLFGFLYGMCVYSVHCTLDSNNIHTRLSSTSIYHRFNNVNVCIGAVVLLPNEQQHSTEQNHRKEHT